MEIEIQATFRVGANSVYALNLFEDLIDSFNPNLVKRKSGDYNNESLVYRSRIAGTILEVIQPEYTNVAVLKVIELFNQPEFEFIYIDTIETD